MWIIDYFRPGMPVLSYPVYDCATEVEAANAFLAKGISQHIVRIKKVDFTN